MEISKLMVGTVEDLKKNHNSEKRLAAKLIGEVSCSIMDRCGSLKRCSGECPEGVVSILVKYNTEGLEPEPTDEQRSQLSALAKIHNRLMEKVKSDTGLENVVYNSQLINIVTDMMKEIESETE